MRRISRRLGILIVAASALRGAGGGPVHADAVADWNATMQATVTPTNPFFQARSAAIVQLADFEAVNAVVGDYEPYLGTIAAPPWASPDAAAIAAAHRALVNLPPARGNPATIAMLDALRAQSLAAIPDGPAKQAGIAAGEDAAAAMLLLRANDGWNVSVPYMPGSHPGDWQPTPPAFAAATFTGWGQVTPFGLQRGSQFRLPTPPALDSVEYANDYNEVKLVGRFDSPFRPQDRTDVARFYAAVTPVQVWNSAARQVSTAQGKSLSENARIFALLAMALADGSISVFETKYYYSSWRPVTAIQAGDTDGNGLTDPDPAWLPLIVTPPFPSYPSAHASLSGAARAVVERTFGHDGHDITLADPRVPDVVLHYSAWGQITGDIDDARVYGGIHFRYDQEAGAQQGRRVGRYLLRHYLRSPLEDDDLGDDN